MAHARVRVTQVTQRDKCSLHNYQETSPALITCVQIATLALLPNEVLTARGERPRPENRVENAVVRFILGRSSATTTQFRTQVKLTPLDCEKRKKERY